MTVEEALSALDEFIEHNEVAPETPLIYDVLVAINEQMTGVAEQSAGDAARVEALEEEVAEGSRRKRR
jgi:hypothetical protein